MDFIFYFLFWEDFGCSSYESSQALFLTAFIGLSPILFLSNQTFIVFVFYLQVSKKYSIYFIEKGSDDTHGAQTIAQTNTIAAI